MDVIFATTPPFDTVSLGDLIDYLKVVDQNSHIEFDFCGVEPAITERGGVHSYRGFYDHLAIGWRHGQYECTVERLLAKLVDAVGGEFTGYKGGEYRMTVKTPVWVDNIGDYSSTAIAGASEIYGSIVLHTRLVGK